MFVHNIMSDSTFVPVGLIKRKSWKQWWIYTLRKKGSQLSPKGECAATTITPGIMGRGATFAPLPILPQSWTQRTNFCTLAFMPLEQNVAPLLYLLLNCAFIAQGGACQRQIQNFVKKYVIFGVALFHDYYNHI